MSSLTFRGLAPLAALVVATGTTPLTAATPSQIGHRSTIQPTTISSPALRHARQVYSYHFKGPPDGIGPTGQLIADQTGSLYGEALGGAKSAQGAVYKLTRTSTGYTESVIYSFGLSPDGYTPMGGLIEDNTGALYGTTERGGSANGGTVFKLTPGPLGYTESIIRSFAGGSDGASPFAGLIDDTTGSLYGTTPVGGGSGCGGMGCGIVFKLTPAASGYTESILYSFVSNGIDGVNPVSGLVADRNGGLYGTTQVGGVFNLGTVFKLTPGTSAYTESVLYSFGTNANDGANPGGILLLDQTGVLVGATSFGGTTNEGTAFELTPTSSGYSESILHNFAGVWDGSIPGGSGLVADAGGSLYGTTFYGGSGCRPVRCGNGTVFKLIPGKAGYTEVMLHWFNDANNGAFPGGVLLDATGGVYGTTYYGGRQGGGYSCCGTVFKLQQY